MAEQATPTASRYVACAVLRAGTSWTASPSSTCHSSHATQLKEYRSGNPPKRDVVRESSISLAQLMQRGALGMMPCMTDPPTAQGDHALAFFTPPNIRDWHWALRLFLDRIERCPLIAQTHGPGGPNQIPSGLLLFCGIARATARQSHRRCIT